MNIDASQYTRIVEAAFRGAGTTERVATPVEQTEGAAYREPGIELRETYTPQALLAGEAELVIAIAQLAIAADRVDDPDEQRLFQEIAAHVYRHANVETTAPTLAPVTDDEQRIDHLRSHAAQLAGKPSASLAFALAYALVISDMDIAPEEGLMLETLREALGLDEDRANDLSSAVGMAVTPE
ncbi:MAG: hypothetical protein ACKV2T_23970 [Kofleriaceae bacterium]